MATIRDVITKKWGGVFLGPENAPQMHTSIHELAQRAGIETPNVYMVDAIPGFGNLGRISAGAILKEDVVLTKGIMDLFGCTDLKGVLDPRLEAVIAHEFFHNKGAPVQMAGRFLPPLLCPLIAVLACHFYQRASQNNDKAQQHHSLDQSEQQVMQNVHTETGQKAHAWQSDAITAAKYLAAAALGLGAGILMTRGLMNHFEYGADAFSKKLMGSGKPLAEALEMLEKETHKIIKEHGAGFEPTLWQQFQRKILHSHPNTKDRIAELMR